MNRISLWYTLVFVVSTSPIYCPPPETNIQKLQLLIKKQQILRTLKKYRSKIQKLDAQRESTPTNDVLALHLLYLRRNREHTAAQLKTGLTLTSPFDIRTSSLQEYVDAQFADPYIRALFLG